MTFKPTAEQRKALENAETFAEALGILRKAAGGWDHLGDAIGTTRFRLIRWSDGGWPRDDGLELLRKAGVPDRLLVPGAEIQRRMLRAEAEIERLRELLQ